MSPNGANLAVTLTQGGPCPPGAPWTRCGPRPRSSAAWNHKILNLLDEPAVARAGRSPGAADPEAPRPRPAACPETTPTALQGRATAFQELVGRAADERGSVTAGLLADE